MKVAVDTRNSGRMGASFKMTFADHQVPYALSVADAKRLCALLVPEIAKVEKRASELRSLSRRDY